MWKRKFCCGDIGFSYLQDCSQQFLGELHSSHLGICEVMRLARLYVGWPKLDHIEEKIQLCRSIFFGDA